MTKTTELIQDGETLLSASRNGYDIPIYDDGFGPLFVHRNSIGISGIVRAQTWEDAYSICEDEFFPEADETIDELVKEYGFKREHVRVLDADGKFVKWETIETPAPDAWPENDCFCEGFGFRPNGPNANDTINHGIYRRDLNGDSLDRLTSELAKELDIILTIEHDEE